MKKVILITLFCFCAISAVLAEESQQVNLKVLDGSIPMPFLMTIAEKAKKVKLKVIFTFTKEKFNEKQQKNTVLVSHKILKDSKSWDKRLHLMTPVELRVHPDNHLDSISQKDLRKVFSGVMITGKNLMSVIIALIFLPYLLKIFLLGFY